MVQRTVVEGVEKAVTPELRGKGLAHPAPDSLKGRGASAGRRNLCTMWHRLLDINSVRVHDHYVDATPH